MNSARVAAIVALTVGLFVGGCSSREEPTPPLEVGDVASNERVVFGAAAGFYCARAGWPKDWDELVDFERARGSDVGVLETFEEPEFETPRAILLTLSYRKGDGAARKVTFIAPPSCGEGVKKSDTRAVSIAGGGVRFRLPERFRLMKGEAVKERWRAPPYPDAAWSSSDGRVIAVRFGDVELDRDDTVDFLADVSEAYQASVPTLAWIARDVISVQGAPMLRHEFENSSSRGVLRSVVLSGSFDHRLFAITVTGPAEVSESVTQAASEITDGLSVR